MSEAMHAHTILEELNGNENIKCFVSQGLCGVVVL